MARVATRKGKFDESCSIVPTRRAGPAETGGVGRSGRTRRGGKLRHQAAPEDVDYRSSRKLDRGLFAKLVAGDWIAAHDNLVICGPTGVGKSWLACALGHKACRDDRSVLYQRVPKLFSTLALARGDGRHARFLAKLGCQIALKVSPLIALKAGSDAYVERPDSQGAFGGLILLGRCGHMSGL